MEIDDGNTKKELEGEADFEGQKVCMYVCVCEMMEYRRLDFGVVKWRRTTELIAT